MYIDAEMERFTKLWDSVMDKKGVTGGEKMKLVLLARNLNEEGVLFHDAAAIGLFVDVQLPKLRNPVVPS